MRKLFLLILGIAAYCSAIGQTSNVKMQSVFIYNFTKMVSWPAAYQSGDFVIGVLGNSPIIAELQNMASTKKVGNQTIVVKTFASAGEISKSHILYVPTSQIANIGAVTGKVSGNSTLIITDSEGATTKGAAINFVIQENKQKFELNESNATKYGLKVSGELQKLAIVK